MKLALIGAALAAATSCLASAGDYLAAEPRQLGRRLDLNDSLEPRGAEQELGTLDKRASSSKAKAVAKAKAAAAAKAKAAKAKAAKAASAKAKAAAA